MSLEVGRVGVRPDQLDNYGRINPNSQFIQNLLNDLPAWTDLPVWKSGTEQLLPVNDDEPETSPILCDIEYPVADLKNNQYFTYRQSLTQKDGKAKIRGIKGKTLVWNQLLSYSGLTSKTSNGITFTVNDDHSITLTGTATAQADFSFTRIDYVKDHKYLVGGLISDSASATGHRLYFFNQNVVGAEIITKNATDYFTPRIRVADGTAITGTVRYCPYVIDLTLMFGVGNEPTIAQFNALFPLSYYKYNTGSLLDFTGTKIETIGINKFDGEWEEGDISNVTGNNTTNTSYWRSKNYISVMPNATYYAYATGITTAKNIRPRFYSASKEYIGSVSWTTNRTLTIPSDVYYLRFSPAKTDIPTHEVCINLSDSSINGKYVAYNGNTTELPTETFFPTGMKSAGAVYDELTPTRAITRIGQVNLGSLTWTYDSTNTVFIGAVSGIKRQAQEVLANLLCPMYKTNTQNQVIGMNANMCISTLNLGDYVVVRNNAYNDVTAFKTAMSGVMLNYELAVEDVQPTMSFGD